MRLKKNSIDIGYSFNLSIDDNTVINFNILVTRLSI